MTTLERELIEKISHMDEEKQRKVLEFVRSIEEPPPQKTYSARELMKLPYEERNRLAKLALESSLDEDFEVFEALDEADFDDG
jgi:hypothetical protein